MTDSTENQSADGSILASSASGNEGDHNSSCSGNNSSLGTGTEESACTASLGGGSGSYPCMVDSSLPKIYRSDYPVTQINGCRQYGPPKSWTGPTPGFGCEIYVKRIPPDFTETELVPLFDRFGKLYEMRLMMDYNNQNRRYCFVRYTTEEDAKVAIEVLNHHFVKDNQTLEAQKSFEKCRLFVGNLPKDLDRKTIEISFRSLFPEMTRFVMHNRIADGEKNRGFAFMDFPDHGAALRAKKQTTPGCMRMWDRDIKIVWANPQRSLDHSGVDEVKTLFVRNIDLTVNTKDLYDLFTRLVPRQDIIKVSRVREFAFVEFSKRELAEMVMHAVQGYVLNKFPLDIEWAMPPLRNSFHNMKNYDFDALLRTKCIANGWDPPILLYGRVFTLSCLQYVTVILRHNGQLHAYFVEIFITGLADVQSRVCEAVISLILENGNLPAPYLVLKVKHDSMMLVGSVSSLSRPVLNLARDVDKSQELFWNEILDMCAAANQLVKYSFDDLYVLYRRELDSGHQFNYLDSIQLDGRIIGCLDQSFRRRPGLSRKLDNREILFVLCDQYSLTNYNFSKKDNYIAETFSSMETVGVSTARYKILPMLPSRFVQTSCSRELKIEAVYFGLNPYSSTTTTIVDHTTGELTLCMANPDHHLAAAAHGAYNCQFFPYQSLDLSIPPPLPPPQSTGAAAIARRVPAPTTVYAALPGPPHVPPPAPPGFYGNANMLAQAMQQLGLGPLGPPPPPAFYRPAVGGPPPPGSLIGPQFYF